MTKTARSTYSPPLVATPPPSPKRGDPNYVPGAWYDQEAVDRVIKALKSLKHTKGRWAGRPFEPEPWQIDWIIAPVFGWKHPDGTRIIRTVYIEIPRKNGKSTLAAGLVIVLLVADGEYGAEVYAAATSKPQAGIVGEEVKKMIGTNPRLRHGVDPLRDVVRVPRTGGIFRVLSRIAEAAHGLNVSGAVIDELHVHKRRDLVDAIESGTGARDQPQVIFITTSGEDEEGSIYDEKHEYTRSVARGTVKDPTFYGVIWAAEKDDDPFAETTWKKANPGYGVTVRPEYLFKEATRARATPAYFPTFCRLHLNLRMKAFAKWLNIADWDASAGIVTPERLVGQAAYAGLDLSSTQDLTAFELVFPGADGSIDILSSFWMPETRVAELTEKHQIPYDQWVKMGYITATEGNVVDYERVRSDINLLGQSYSIKRISIDRWNATNIATNLAADGFEVAMMGQGYASMSAPSKELERLVLAHKARHGGNPVLRWMADIVEVATDNNDNIKPVKPDRRKSAKRIDGIVAVVMGIDGWMRDQEANEDPDARVIYGF